VEISRPASHEHAEPPLHALRVDGDDDRLAAIAARERRDEIRIPEGGCIEADLVGPGVDRRRGRALVADAAADGQRQKDLVRDRADRPGQRLAAFERGGDVEDHHFIDPLDVVASRELRGVAGMPELLDASLDLMTRLVNFKRFVFVPSATSARELLTIGNALRPMEYAVIDTNKENLARIQAGHYRGEAWTKLGQRVREFVDSCGDKILVGMYRASSLAPAQMFYAHAEHVHQAALIAMADSILQDHRGFPMLIDLADSICGRIFGAHDFAASAQLAYAQAGAPYQYLGERQTRA